MTALPTEQGSVVLGRNTLGLRIPLMLMVSPEDPIADPVWRNSHGNAWSEEHLLEYGFDILHDNRGWA